MLEIEGTLRTVGGLLGIKDWTASGMYDPRADVPSQGTALASASLSVGIRQIGSVCHFVSGQPPPDLKSDRVHPGINMLGAQLQQTLLTVFIA